MTSGQYSFGRRSYRGRIHRMPGSAVVDISALLGIYQRCRFRRFMMPTVQAPALSRVTGHDHWRSVPTLTTDPHPPNLRQLAAGKKA